MNKKTALVTGAGSGIGRAISIRFAKEEYSVFLVGSRPEPLYYTQEIIESLDGESVVIVADLESSEGIKYVSDTVRNEINYLNVVVNNAGKAMFKDYHSFSHDEVMSLFNINTVVPFMLTNSLLDLLENAPSADIINISSEASFRPEASHMIYGATKAALNFISRSYAQVLATSKIKVNTIAPGAVETPMLLAVLDGNPFLPPLGSLLQPEEIANWVLHIIQSRGITGAVITVDGGTSLPIYKSIESEK